MAKIQVSIREYRECIVEFDLDESMTIEQAHAAAAGWYYGDPNILLNAPNTQVRIYKPWTNMKKKVVNSKAVF